MDTGPGDGPWGSGRGPPASERTQPGPEADHPPTPAPRADPPTWGVGGPRLGGTRGHPPVRAALAVRANRHPLRKGRRPNIPIACVSLIYPLEGFRPPRFPNWPCLLVKDSAILCPMATRPGTSRLDRAKAAGVTDPQTLESLKPPTKQRLRDDERCGAITKAGTPCQAGRGASTDHPGYGHCAKHGGTTEAGNKAAMKEMGRDLVVQYKTQFSRFGGDRRDASIASLTPEQALLEEVRRSAAMVRFLEDRIALWNLNDVAQATIEAFVSSNSKRQRKDASLKESVEAVLHSLDSENPDSPAYLPALTQTHHQTGIQSFTEVQAWLTVYRDERAHLTRTAKMCIDAGVATRLVAIAEDQGRILSSAVRTILTALNLSPEQSALVPSIVPQVLRAVATDSPIPDISTLGTTA
jgi:hypothetical protein